MTGTVGAAERSGPSFVAGAGLGSTELRFDEKLDADTGFTSYTLFGSAALGKFYATLLYGDSIESENVSEEDELGEASRTDLDLTIGYRIGRGWTLFGGYKRGETAIDFRVRDTDIEQRERYREDGFYVGASYAWRFERAGSLSLTLAYIAFETDLRFTAGFDEEDEEDGEDEEEALEFDDLEGTFSGDSDGYSAGIGWVMPLGSRLAFRTQLKVNAFDLEVVHEGRTFRPDQRLTYFDVGLLYAF